MEKPKSEIRVTISTNGPYLVSGNIPLTEQTIVTDADGGSQDWIEGKQYPAQIKYALCR